MVTSQQIRQYRQDGAIVLRGVLSIQMIERLRVAVESVLQNLSADSDEYANAGEGRFAQDMFMHRRQDSAGEVFRDLMFNSALAQTAGQVMGANSIRFFYDQMFVKEPGSVAPTPWHQDLPYWPLRGDQICGIWCPLDPVDLNSGVVQYVRGSHLAGKWYRPRHFGGDEAYQGASGDVIPDIDATTRPEDRLSWVMEPGDCIVFHGLTIHGATGNRSAVRRRRAVSLRWLGDDAVYDDRPGTYPFDVVGLTAGQPLTSERYPLVWTRKP
jgi:ectoine hydroxylase-related dioxygenase (phytanoyl-CoA dioxygenase family)